MKKIIVAIDGFSGCGKSTLARQLAEELQYLYIDTGAMYRAITLYFLENNLPVKETPDIKEVLKNIELGFYKNERTGKNEITLNKRNVEDKIRGIEVAGRVSEIAAIPAIRKFAVAAQREMGTQKRVVMDGRDIGTVVFPQAELKLFVTADPEIRVERRFLELKENNPDIQRDKIRENLEQRDYADTHRADSPLRQADDAVVIDNSHLSKEEQLQKALQLVEQVIHQD